MEMKEGSSLYCTALLLFVHVTGMFGYVHVNLVAFFLPGV
jgi:hypothetical protein